MRHLNGLKKLNRTSSHRISMFRNLANSLIKYESITTTLPKAKALRKVIEPLITISKVSSVSSQRTFGVHEPELPLLLKVHCVLAP